MFTLIFVCVVISFLILYILWLTYKNNDLEKENFLMSCEINKYVRENSKLRRELRDVLPIEREGTRNNKKSTKLHHN